jgi:hypothetical protein
VIYLTSVLVILNTAFATLDLHFFFNVTVVWSNAPTVTDTILLWEFAPLRGFIIGIYPQLPHKIHVFM